MRILLLNQCFHPDVVATGQYLSDLARTLAERGHQVTVIASRRGYDNPALTFPARETWHGVDVRRIWTLNLGKTSKWRRAVSFTSFWLSCIVELMRVPRCEVVVALTSPPLISFLAALLVQMNNLGAHLVSRISYLAGRTANEPRETSEAIREARGSDMKDPLPSPLPIPAWERVRVRAAGGIASKRAALVLWLMDLNPDEALAAGWLRPESLTARMLIACQGYSCRAASRLIALDRFMAERLARAGVPAEKVSIIPPWSHDDHVRYDHTGRVAFRAAHGLADKYVVMYSGNHSPCHPLDTLLAAAQRLAVDPRIAFCFIGGGSEFTRVQAFAATHRLNNILCLPYQPLDTLSASLSAADAHVVVMGNAFIGIIHPCKPYNILAVGLPLLYIGPEQSHVTDLFAQLGPQRLQGQIRHGEVDALVALIQQAAHNGQATAPSNNGYAVAGRFSKGVLLPQLVDLLEGLKATG